MSTLINNPILTGFHPDPCMICVDGIFYLANSTFEWFPGVEISKSADLVNWELAARPLDTKEMLDMAGEMHSEGIWAPCLTYNETEKRFYLIFTDVKTSQNDPFKDCHNYLTSAPTIEGPWTKPVYLNSSGFDPSLFHDDDGKKWFVNMEWDFRQTGRECFSGILLQEYDDKKECLTGEIYKIFLGTDTGCVEGPHLYKKGDWYYLMTAEGGTGYSHQVTLARSKKITGPYEVHPLNPLVTAWEGDGKMPTSKEQYFEFAGKSYLKKAGHASWCKDAQGNWYLVHLCGRPVDEDYRCTLGRETALQKLVWKEDGWCYLENGTHFPADQIEVPFDAKKKEVKEKIYHFEDTDFLKDFQSLRVPFEESWGWLDKTDHTLVLKGRESVVSRFSQSLLARRQTDMRFEAKVELEFCPDNFQQMAGLIYRYCETNLFYCYMTYDERTASNALCVIQIVDGKYKQLEQIPIAKSKVLLGIEVDGPKGQFYYEDGKGKQIIGGTLDVGVLSDEFVKPMGFTGAFVGFCVQDMQAQKKTAKFSKFWYTVK